MRQTSASDGSDPKQKPSSPMGASTAACPLPIHVAIELLTCISEQSSVGGIVARHAPKLLPTGRPPAAVSRLFNKGLAEPPSWRRS